MCAHKMKTIIAVTCDVRRPLADGTVPLVVKLTKSRKRKYLRTGITVQPHHWDFKKSKPKTNCPNREYIEAIITEKLREYQQQVLEFQTISRDYSLTKLVESVEKPTKDITVEKYLETIIKTLISENKIGNATHYQSLLNSLHKFTKLAQILFVDIDVIFLNRYEAHLRKKGNRGNTINIKMRTLRATYNKAIKDNLIKAEYYPFNDYNVAKLKENTLKRAISKENILKIIDFDVNSISKRPWSSLQLSKDLFLFSYFGRGINMIDMAYLKKENIINDRIIYERHKTKKLINFQLQPLAIEIIKKYEKCDDKYLFPILDEVVNISLEQQYRRVKKVTYVANKNLKKIGEALNIPTNLTTYVARHSYATVLKRSGVSTSIISESLGHSSEKITQIYLDSFENSQIDEAMKNLL